MANENPIWEAGRIHSELLKLGFEICERTVARYMPKRTTDERKAQSWQTFLKNHQGYICAIDLFTVFTINFKQLYGFILLTWQNGICGRTIGTFRRELLDHVIVKDDWHLDRLLLEFADYYNYNRTHRSLDKDSPCGRIINSPAKIQ
jgi:hypothetical protein